MSKFKIGVTERGDAAVHLNEWSPKADGLDAIIAITKNITVELISFLSSPKIKNKTILHASITGYGGTKLEPWVPTFETSKTAVSKLIQSGFPANQIVLRIDPIIPTDKGLQTVRRVLEKFKEFGIPRVRFSFIQYYRHADLRFARIGWSFPKYGESDKERAFSLMNEYTDIYEFHACATVVPEKFSHIARQTGCVSETDLNILSLESELSGTSYQRPACLCCSDKNELLSHRNPCKHGCLYCYWKDA